MQAAYPVLFAALPHAAEPCLLCRGFGQADQKAHKADYLMPLSSYCLQSDLQMAKLSIAKVHMMTSMHTLIHNGLK